MSTQTFPRVAILVPTHSESLDVLNLTLQSIREQNYPNFCVVVCDDAKPLRSHVRDQALSFGFRYAGKVGNTEKKAGNLNNALPIVYDAEYIAVVDAGDVLLPDFVSTLVPIMEADRGLGFVQALTEPGNVDDIQQLLGVHYVPASSNLRRKAIGAVFGAQHQYCCGSAFLLRMSALKQLGGFPSKCVSDDVHLSLLLHDKGWRSIRPSVVLGKAPYAAGLTNLLKQLERWTIGSLQIMLLKQAWSSRYAFRPRLKVMAFALLQLSECFSLLPIFIPLLFLIAGPTASMRALLWTFGVTMGLRYATGVFRRRTFWWETIYSTVAALGLAKALSRFLFDPWGVPFRVTQKSSASALDEAGGKALVHPLYLYCALYLVAIFKYIHGPTDEIQQHAVFSFVLCVWVAYTLTALGHSIYVCRVATRKAMTNNCISEAHV